MTTVKELLRGQAHTGVVTISPQATVYAALELLAQHDIGALPVVEHGQLVGIFSERDYARKVILEGRASQSTHVQDLMTRAVITISPAQTVERCMWLMTNNRIRHLPVVDGGRLAGLVSIGDVLKALLDQQSETIGRLTAPDSQLLDQ